MFGCGVQLVDPTVTLRQFEQEWQKICQMFGIRRHWRFVSNGRQLNPQWPLSGFVQNESDGASSLTVTMDSRVEDL